MIRPAKFGDIPALYGILLQMYERTRYVAHGSVDERAAKAILMQSIQRHGKKSLGGSVVFVSCREGEEPTGFILGTLDRVYHIGTKLMATDIFFVTGKGSRPRDGGKLLDAFLDWTATVPGLFEVTMGATDAVDDFTRTGNLYKRRGFTLRGEIYTRSVA